MDYKYIEQLLEQYWRCETSLIEEEQLRSFFMMHKDIPAHLLKYRDLFVYQQLQQEVGLSTDFDARVVAEVEKPVVRARKLTLIGRFMPVLKAAAVIAVMVSLGNVAQHTFFGNDQLDYNYETYQDTYDDPEVAYKEVSSALMMLSEGINKSQEQHLADSVDAKVEMIKE